LELLKM